MHLGVFTGLYKSSITQNECCRYIKIRKSDIGHKTI